MFLEGKTADSRYFLLIKPDLLLKFGVHKCTASIQFIIFTEIYRINCFLFRMYFAFVFCSKRRHFAPSAICILVYVLPNYLFWKDWITYNKCLITEKWMRSLKSCCLACHLRIVKAFLDHISLVIFGNLDYNMHIMSGISSTF